MSLNTTSKVILESSKGDIEIEMYAKEIPLVRDFLTLCLKGELQNKPLVYENDLVVCDCAIEGFKVQKHNRIRLAKGSVGLLSTKLVINMSDQLLEIPDLTLIGKIVGNSVYNLVKIKDSEFETVIKQIQVPVVYFEDLELIKKHPKQPTESVKITEAQPKKKKPKVKLDYDVEDDGFKMSSIYDKKDLHRNLQATTHTKSKSTNAYASADANAPKQSSDINGVSEPINEKSTGTDKIQVDPNQQESQIAVDSTEKPAPSSDVASELKIKTDHSSSEVNDKAVSTQLQGPYSSNKDAKGISDPKRSLDTYEDIPLAELSSHKYIVQ